MECVVAWQILGVEDVVVKFVVVVVKYVVVVEGEVSFLQRPVIVSVEEVVRRDTLLCRRLDGVESRCEGGAEGGEEVIEVFSLKLSS